MKAFFATKKGKVVSGIAVLIVIVSVISVFATLLFSGQDGGKEDGKKDSQAIHSIEKEDADKTTDDDKKTDADKKPEGEGLTVSDSDQDSTNSENVVDGSDLFGESNKDQTDTPSDNTDKDNTDKDNTDKEMWGPLF